MSSKKIIVAGAGCAIADLIFNGVSFHSTGFGKYLSKNPGDGGLGPGKLVFTEELEEFAGRSYKEILYDIVGDRTPDVMNVGGPSLVSLILASQMLHSGDFEVKFFGIAGKDENGNKILSMVQKTPLDIGHYMLSGNKVTPFTDVFSDPDFDHGVGERTFVNNIGAAWDYGPDQIDDELFQAHLVCFGGTALVPKMHDNLTFLLRKARQHNCLTLVNTVFDFRNQKRNPDMPWPLVDAVDDYQLIDVLIMDCEEALKISGRTSMDEAATFFKSTQVGAFIITNGADELQACSNGTVFRKTEIRKFPSSALVREEIRSNPQSKGDTTGCGDNFVGGIITSLALQLKNSRIGEFTLETAISMGVSAGGRACFTVGGTCLEKVPGDLRHQIETIQRDYLTRIDLDHLSPGL